MNGLYEKRMKLHHWIPGFFACLLLLHTGCEKKFDEYYKVPEDLIGTILDVLEEDGNYTQFCRAVEMVEFDDVLGKTGNFTVFAPDDDAFTEFFNEYGYSSLDDIPEEELKGIVFYHIVFWAYSRFMLLYGLNIQDVEIDYSTENFKQPTRYTPPMTVEFDTLGRQYNVYHETKYIPVYSNEYFSELDLDAAENYEFLYPGTTFKGFHVDRAEVTEYDVPAQNGWIHRINRVLVPPPNHDEILEEREEFSMFRELVEKNTYYAYSSSYTTAQDNEGDVNEDGILDSLFLKMNSIFPSGTSPDVENVASNGYRNTLTLFAPTNAALQQFLAERTSGYASLDQIGEYWINWYLSHYIGTNYWPSQFSTMTADWEWDLTSSLVECNISEGDIQYARMASNGPFCGINKYLLPKIFESVAQPIMGNSDYEWFCDMLVFYLADRLLNEENLVFTLFAPSNEAMHAAGYTFRTGIGGYGLYHQDSPLTPLSPRVATDIVNTHLVFGELAEDDFEVGTFIEASQNTYIGVTEQGIFAGGDLAPAQLGSPMEVGGKGIVYPIDRILVSPHESIFEIISDPGTYQQYQKFYQLCYQAGLFVFDENLLPESLDNISIGNYYTCFIPTNEALEEGLANGIIPSDEDSLQQFLRYHFVEGVVFDDGKVSGELNTTRIDEESGYLFNTIEIINQKYDLKIKDNQGNIRTVIHADHMAEDGVIHQIDSYLLYN
jgi:uncharacterized surface protein with fasciclin (FAS1) repeats